MILILALACVDEKDLAETKTDLMAGLAATDVRADELQVRIASLEREHEVDLARIEALEGELLALEAIAAVLPGQVERASLVAGEVEAQVDEARADWESAAAALDARMAAVESDELTFLAWQDSLEPLWDYLAVDTSTDSLTITGANLYIQSGSGATDGAVNGLGNLIIGYDESDAGTVKSGSHNLILGSYNTYRSWGGIVGGTENAVTAPSAVVIGGRNNAANDDFAVVVGGANNEADGEYAVVVGGAANDAGGAASAVLGGAFNQASGDSSVIAGGVGNDALADYSAILGGSSNQASGLYSTVYGGKGVSAGDAYEYAP